MDLRNKIPPIPLIRLLESAALWVVAETIVHRRGDPNNHTAREAANNAAETLRTNIRVLATETEFAVAKSQPPPQGNLP